MNKPRAIELYLLHMVAGLFTGLFILLSILFYIFSEQGLLFTFNDYILIHSENKLLFFFDSFPLWGILSGYLLARLKIRSYTAIDLYKEKHSAVTKIINEALKDLSIGNLIVEYQSKDIDAEIAQNLRDLQSNLIENRKKEIKTREAESQRNWTSSGLAEFGDILRTFSNDLEKLSYEMISKLVRYMKINQGGFFIIEDKGSSKKIRMIASHAYERKKFPDQVLNWGEGIIGAVAIEQKSYYTDKIPDSYLHITSGLGRANPKHLLIVPMIINSEVFGIFELASFNKFETYQIEFVERLAENTATTLNIMKNNFRTEQLLKETQEQAKKLEEKDENVRQKMEELQYIQAEASKQSEQFMYFTNTVNHTMIRAEYDTNGNLVYANTRFLKFLSYPGSREIQDRHISTFIHQEDWVWFESIWERITSGGEHFEGFIRHVTKLGIQLWTLSTFTCERNEEGNVKNILLLAIDTTEEKSEMQKYHSRLEAFNQLVNRAEFGLDGKLSFSNSLFRKTLSYSEDELEFKNIFDFFLPEDQERFNEIWEQVISGSEFQGQIRMIGKFEIERWFKVLLSVTKDIYGETEKIILLGFDITHEKTLEATALDTGNKLNEREQELQIVQIDQKKQVETLSARYVKETNAIKEELKIFTNYFEKDKNPSIIINNLSFVLHTNKAAEKFFNFKRKDLINNKISAFFSSEQDSEIMDHFIDPSKPIIEGNHSKITIRLKTGKTLRTDLSILKVNLHRELIFILIVNED